LFNNLARLKISGKRDARGWQEEHTNSKIVGAGQSHVLVLEFSSEKRAWKRGQQASAIIRFSVSVLSAAMRQIGQNSQGLLDQKVASRARDSGQKACTTCIMFPTGLIERIVATRGRTG
jgi:hypothetical protein